MRGLRIADEVKAMNVLKNISYYRLSGYWYPLLSDKQNHVFKENATFEAAFNLYKFDRELRKLMILELEKIEIAFRTRMAYVLSTAYKSVMYAHTIPEFGTDGCAFSLCFQKMQPTHGLPTKM